MTDARRERTQGDEAVRDAGSVDGGYASAAAKASLAPENSFEVGRMARPQDESERVAVTSGRPEDSTIAVQVVGRTDVGLVREHNEDNYLLADLATGSRDAQTFREVSSAGLLLAVCDGMGGAAAGEVASQMAVDTLYEMMRRSVPTTDRDGLARNLVRSIEEAGGRIFEAARADRSRRGMGTTATVAALMDKTLFVGQVGDSRAYILRSGELKQITKDQSLVNQLIEAGQLTEDEAEAFEHSNIILQALGTTEQVSVDLTFLELRRGDRLLMCSDGLSGLVHGETIRDTLRDVHDLAACCERLIELAKEGGGHDNVTVILAEFAGDGLTPPGANDLVGYQQYPLPLDADRPRALPLQSDMPTLSPPPVSLPSGHGDPGYDARSEPRAPSIVPQGGGSRLLFLAVLLLGTAGALYYFLVARARNVPQVEAHQMVEPPSARVVPQVEVVVKTDVDAGELLVDGESYGTASGGQWVLELPPGTHRLEIRAGGTSINYELITVREGVPATVVLAMPSGADERLTDGSTKTDDGEDARARHRERAAREEGKAIVGEPVRVPRIDPRERGASPREALPPSAAPPPVTSVGKPVAAPGTKAPAALDTKPEAGPAAASPGASEAGTGVAPRDR